MQFTAVVLMTLLTIKLLLLYRWTKEDKVASRARWMMAVATSILAIHFTLQLTLGLRLMGITQSVMLNLTMLIPASFLFSMAVLSLQQQGRLSRWERLVGPLTWVTAVAMLVAAIAADGQPLLNDTPQRKQAETASALCYMAMQCYYTWRHTTALRAMHRALNDYYDRDKDGMLRWMQLSIVGLMLLALMVPVAIFGSGPWLLVIAFSIYFSIFYLVDSFCYYLTSNAPSQMQEAEQNAEEEEIEKQKETSSEPATPEVTERIGKAVAQWVSRGGHLHSGITQPIAAAEIGIPKYQLTTWLHQQGMKYNEWLASLRIAEAKRVLLEHPEWNIDAIAEHCGFKDRTTLHRKFKELVGMTPAEYVNHHSSETGL